VCPRYKLDEELSASGLGPIGDTTTAKRHRATTHVRDVLLMTTARGADGVGG
jgi:hypothetical protein